MLRRSRWVQHSSCEHFSQEGAALVCAAQVHCADWLTEVDAMEELGVKAEIEAAYASTASRRLSDVLAEELQHLQLIRHHNGRSNAGGSL